MTLPPEKMDPQMFDMIARLGVPYIIMHMQGTPQNMQMIRIMTIC